MGVFASVYICKHRSLHTALSVGQLRTFTPRFWDTLSNIEMKILVTTLGLLSLLLVINASPLPLSSSYELLHSRCHVKGGKMAATFTVRSDFAKLQRVEIVTHDRNSIRRSHEKQTHSTLTTRTWEVHEAVSPTIYRVDLRMYHDYGLAKTFVCYVNEVQVEIDHTSIFWYAERVSRRNDWILLARLAFYVAVGFAIITFIAAKFSLHVRLFGEVSINNHKV
ncbi:protein HCMV US3 [Cynomolgus macaque cytomegalovirus strain Mauritius]|uniref:Protein HCMV US3 n=2 Tax=Cytomegalovirus TaxID=10358 RepID=A0A0K1GZW5_9BETA|nr:protein HCMV US3 [Cynomolgus macaque cytomegalovirus strain Mauritius]AXG21918.1 protein HCMV US3 [synthetic construct]AXG22187.1 protein HCMV US3 [synthetic construct]